MTVKELKEKLNDFDDDMEIIIGMQQALDVNIAYEIKSSVDEYNAIDLNGKDYRAVVIIEGSRIGNVDYQKKKTKKKEIETIEEGIEELKKMVALRNKMGGSLYWNVHNDKCIEIANDLSQMGANKTEIEEILGVGFEKNFG